MSHSNILILISRRSRPSQRYRPRLDWLEKRFVLSTTIDFENQPQYTSITNQYESLGVNFSGAEILSSTGILNPIYPPHSGVNVVDNDQSSTITATAANGSTWTEASGYVTGDMNAVMTAYNASGVAVGSAATGGTNYVGAGTPNILLDVKANSISYVEFTCNTRKDSFTLDDFSFQVNDVELDINGLSNSQKTTLGGLVVMSADNNGAPRSEITIQKSIENVVLTENNSKVAIYTSATGGNPLTFNGTDNVFASSSLPINLYVQGTSYSDTMRDVQLTLTAQSPGYGSDSVNFTVLWVDQPTVDLSSSDSVSSDNTAKSAYESLTNGIDQLGNVRYYGVDDTTGQPEDGFGWGTQASATVHPNNFSYPGVDLHLDRMAQYIDYVGTNSNYVERSSSPFINDISKPQYRDDTPSSKGVIYDLDVPGPNIYPAPAGLIQRYRANFMAYADVMVNGNLINASATTNYYVDISIEQLDSPQGTNWEVVYDIPGDNTAGLGTTNLTWDLTKKKH